MSICKSFPPVVSPESRVLILGSMPGRKSLEMQQYYAHPQNRFWKLLAALFAAELPTDYQAKLALLQQNRLALWDVLGVCERDGKLKCFLKIKSPRNNKCGIFAQRMTGHTIRFKI